MLGQLNLVDPKLGDGAASRNDFHPPGDMQVGEKFLSDIVQALMQSPQWPHAALIMTFDEHGGIYDHVPPPPACAPDDIAPMLGGGDTPAATSPTTACACRSSSISPYAKPHFVSHAVYDHTSIMRFIETRFKLGGADRSATPTPIR